MCVSQDMWQKHWGVPEQEHVVLRGTQQSNTLATGDSSALTALGKERACSTRQARTTTISFLRTVKI